VALVLLALARTSSAAFGGALIAAVMIPHVVAAPAMGALADRVRRRRPLYAGALAGYGAALAGCGVLAGRAPAALVLAIGAAGGCCAPLVTGGLTGLLRDLVPTGARNRAYSLDAMSYNAAGICGPVVAGLLVTAFGPGPATLVVAASAIVGGLVLCTLPIGAREPVPGDDRPSMLGGVVTVWRDRVLRAVTTATSVGMLGDGALPLVAALLATQYHAGWAAGALLSAVAAGALVGALAYARHPVGADRPARVVMLGLVAGGLPLLLVPVTGNVAVSLALFAVSGFFVGPQVSALFTSRDQQAPAEFHTQVFTFGAGLKITAAALGAALAGAVGSNGAGGTGLGGNALVLAVAGCHIVAGGIGALLLRGRR
jgi:hypothetical protein